MIFDSVYYIILMIFWVIGLDWIGSGRRTWVSPSAFYRLYILFYSSQTSFKRIDYRPIHPPSTVTTSPVTYALARLAKKSVTPLKSSGVPQRPIGILAKILPALSGSFSNASFISVATYPGAIALTLTPRADHSFDSAFVSCATPPFAAA